MPRSLKKGPFIDDHLQKKVDSMNASGDRRVIKRVRAVEIAPACGSHARVHAVQAVPSTSPKRVGHFGEFAPAPQGRTTPAKSDRVTPDARDHCPLRYHPRRRRRFEVLSSRRQDANDAREILLSRAAGPRPSCAARIAIANAGQRTSRRRSSSSCAPTPTRATLNRGSRVRAAVRTDQKP